jgi:hypothetical protein
MVRAMTVRPIGGRAPWITWPLICEVLLLAGLFAAYLGGRHLANGNTVHAVANASTVWNLERALLLPDESMLQQWTLGWTYTARLVNIYYLGAHFPSIILTLLWLFCRRPSCYARVRAELVLLTGVALAVHVLFPLAPPRLMPELGMVDTMSAVGPSAYPSGAESVTNQYAAMPSLHVGWAILVAVAVIRSGRGRARLLVLAHPALTVAVVVVTANHYWIDGLIASVLVAAAILTVTAWRRRRGRPGGYGALITQGRLHGEPDDYLSAFRPTHCRETAFWGRWLHEVVRRPRR